MNAHIWLQHLEVEQRHHIGVVHPLGHHSFHGCAKAISGSLAAAFNNLQGRTR